MRLTLSTVAWLALCGCFSGTSENGATSGTLGSGAAGVSSGASSTAGASGSAAATSGASSGCLANLMVSTTSVDFGSVQVGTAPAATDVVFSNQGCQSALLDINTEDTAPEFTLTNAAGFLLNDVQTVGPGATYTITVAFEPAAAGNFASSFSFTACIEPTACVAPVSVALKGEGVSSVCTETWQPCTAGGVCCDPVAVCQDATLSNVCCVPDGVQLDSGNVGDCCSQNGTNENGACVPANCTAGAVCTPANVCDVGVTTCSSGAQTCVDMGPSSAAFGRHCDGGEICLDGGLCALPP